MNRTLKDYAMLTLKGIGMGAADVVPGVSGGTIAFLVGIYEELVDSIKQVNLKTLGMLARGRFAEFWRAVNGNFLISVVLGIMISIFSLAKVITYMLETHPIIVWSFFFGLVLASTWVVSRRVRHWSIWSMVLFAVGCAAAFYITVATPTQTPDAYWFILLSGAIAICAMILPGISGSFILVLLGKYFFVMQAVKSFDLPVIATFGVGAACGIVTFANVLSWLLRKHYNNTIALLSGFMLGSLNKVWPWKETLESTFDDHGKLIVLREANILPDTLIWQGFALMLFGFLLVIAIERFSEKKEGE